MKTYKERFGPSSFAELKKDVVKLHDLLEARENGDVTYDEIESDLSTALVSIAFECNHIGALMEELYVLDIDLDENTRLRDLE